MAAYPLRYTFDVGEAVLPKLFLAVAPLPFGFELGVGLVVRNLERVAIPVLQPVRPVLGLVFPVPLAELDVVGLVHLPVPARARAAEEVEPTVDDLEGIGADARLERVVRAARAVAAERRDVTFGLSEECVLVRGAGEAVSQAVVRGLDRRVALHRLADGVVRDRVVAAQHQRAVVAVADHVARRAAACDEDDERDECEVREADAGPHRLPEGVPEPSYANTFRRLSCGTNSLCVQLEQQGCPIAFPIRLGVIFQAHHVHGLDQPDPRRRQRQGRAAPVVGSQLHFVLRRLLAERGHQGTRQRFAEVQQAKVEAVARHKRVQVVGRHQFERETERRLQRRVQGVAIRRQIGFGAAHEVLARLLAGLAESRALCKDVFEAFLAQVALELHGRQSDEIGCAPVAQQGGAGGTDLDDGSGVIAQLRGDRLASPRVAATELSKPVGDVG